MARSTNRFPRWAVRVVVAALPALVVAGVASAAVMSGDEPKGGDTVVAGGPDVAVRPATEGAPVPFAGALNTPSVPVPPAPPVSLPPLPVPLPPAPAPTTAPATTVARSAAATTVPATAAPSPSVATSTTATVTLVNQFSGAVRLEINGKAYDLAAGQEIKNVSVTPAASGNDAIGVIWVEIPTCGVGDAMGYFVAGKSYVLSVVTGLGTCTVNGAKGPDFRVTPA